MHELAITQNIISIAEKNAPEGAPITAVRLQIGRLTGFVPDCIRFYFESLTRGTRLEGAELEIETTPGRALCRRCGREVELEEPILICPECAAIDIEVTSGRELLVKSIQVESEEEA